MSAKLAKLSGAARARGVGVSRARSLGVSSRARSVNEML